MFKNRLLKWLLAPFFVFVDDDNGGGGDRGDDFAPSDTDAADAKAALEAKEAADKAAADKAALEAKEAADKEAADKAAADKEAAEAAAKGKGEGSDDDKKGKKDSRIPLSRHEQILAKERERREAAERELASIRKNEQTTKVNETIAKAEEKVDELQAKYDKELADGNLDKAKAIMKEIRTLERDINDQKVEMKATEATERAVEVARYDIVVDRIEEAYPEMNPQHEDFDRDKMMEVLELKEAYELKGYKASQALQKAVNILLGAANKKQKTATEATPRVNEDDAAAAAAKKEERETEARKKAIDAAGKQPPSTAKVGQEHDKAGGQLDAKMVMKMDQDAFAKLDERELARLRGDEM